MTVHNDDEFYRHGEGWDSHLVAGLDMLLTLVLSQRKSGAFYETLWVPVISRLHGLFL